MVSVYIEHAISVLRARAPTADHSKLTNYTAPQKISNHTPPHAEIYILATTSIIFQLE